MTSGCGVPTCPAPSTIPPAPNPSRTASSSRPSRHARSASPLACTSKVSRNLAGPHAGMRPPHVIISRGANIYPQEVDDVDNPTASLRDVDADLLGKHPELYPDLTVTQQYGIPYETVMDIQLAVLRERFDTLVHKVRSEEPRLNSSHVEISYAV